MMLNCDKFFIKALQNAGYDLDYKRVVEIYRESREIPACQARKKRNEIEKEMLLRMVMHQEKLNKGVKRKEF